MSTLWDDIRQAVRNLRANPGFSFASTVTLALAIAANATVFSWIEATLLDPIPGVRGTRGLAAITRGQRSLSPPPPFSYPDYKDLREATHSFSAMLAYHDDAVVLTGDARPQRLWGAVVSANYFDVLRMRPALGRFFLPAEEGAQGAAAVVVISDDLWRSRFASDTRVLGRTLHINDHAYTVIGVAPSGFHGVKTGLRSDIFIPLTMDRMVFGGTRFPRREQPWLNAVGRLRPGVTLAEAEREANLLMSRLVTQYRDAHRGANEISLDPLWRSPFGANGYMWRSLPVLMALAAAVLLLACANVAGLQLVRFLSRRREIAIRVSMGASRGRIVRGLLTESLLVSLLGGGGAIALTFWTAGALDRFVPKTSTPVALEGHVNTVVLLATLAFATVAGVLSGTLPAIRSSVVSPAAVLKEEGTRSSVGAHRGRLSNGLVVMQIALSLVLLVAAGLFIRSLENTRRLDPGFDADHVVLASLEVSPATGYTKTETALAFQQALLQRVQALPGVEAATLAEWVPLTLNVRTEEVTPDGYLPREHESMEVRRAYVGASYFETMGIALLAGRGIARTDTRASEPVVVVNQAFGDRYWPGQQALGRTVQARGRAHRVVGVTPNTAAFRPGEPPQPFFYMPMAQYWQWETILHVRVAGDPQAAAPEIVAAVHAQNPELPIFSVTTLRSTVGMATIFQRVAATLVGAFGLVAIVLAAVGVYAVIAYAARQRTQEIAIRMALGASGREVAELVMRRGLLLTAAGVVLGIGGAVFVASLLQSSLFQVPTLDPLTFSAVVLLLVTVALAACGIPAWRALRIELSTALREG